MSCNGCSVFPLIQSVQGVRDLANIVVFDSNPLAYETDQIFCYCNKRDDGSEMILCETCDMYYHSCVATALASRMTRATNCGKVN